MKYSKPPLSIADQIARLKQRGLKFNDEQKAAHYLSNISYYRLRAYTYPYKNIYDNKLYAQLCCINYITRIISPKSSFVADLKNLLGTCDLVDCREMGFPNNWKVEPLWK